jgi:hypothetical protein
MSKVEPMLTAIEARGKEFVRRKKMLSRSILDSIHERLTVASRNGSFERSTAKVERRELSEYQRSAPRISNIFSQILGEKSEEPAEQAGRPQLSPLARKRKQSPPCRYDKFKGFLTNLKADMDETSASRAKSTGLNLSLGGERREPADGSRSKWEGFTHVWLDESAKSFRVLKPVKMLGLDQCEMTVEELVRRFTKNWREWNGVGEAQNKSHSEWLKRVCRNKNIFLVKMVFEDPSLKRALNENLLGELIYGKQLTSNRPGLAADHRKAPAKPLAEFVPAADHTSAVIKGAIEDLLELNSLVEYDMVRSKEENYKNNFRGLKAQLHKNESLHAGIQETVNERYWNDPLQRPGCSRLLNMIDKQVSMNPFQVRAHTPLSDLLEFEEKFGKLHSITWKMRSAALVLGKQGQTSALERADL